MKIVTAVIAIVAVLAIAFQVAIHDIAANLTRAHTPKVEVVEAQNGATASTIVAEGSIVPQSVVNVALQPGIEGTVTHLFANVGQHVARGQVLAEVDSDVQQQHAVRADAAVADAQANYNLVLEPYLPEQIEQQQLKVQGDKDTVDQAIAARDLLLHGNRPEEVAEARATSDAATAQLALAQSTYTRDQDLYNQNLLARADYEAAQTGLTVAQDNLTTAEQALAVVKEGPRQEDIAEQNDLLEHDRTLLDADEAQYRLMLKGPRQDSVREAAAVLTTAVSNASEQHLLLGRRFVRAPIAGTISARNVSAGELIASGPVHTYGVEPLVQNDESLFEIRNDSNVEFLANVDQMYYGKVAVGEPVTVDVESLPGVEFHGRISSVAPVINPQTIQHPGGISTVDPLTPYTFDAWVSISNPSPALAPGLAGQISIEQTSDGLIVPDSAITTFSLGYGTVYVESHGIVHVRSVRYDETNDGQIRILRGLSPGEHVVVSQSASLHDGISVAPKLISADELGAQAQAASN